MRYTAYAPRQVLMIQLNQCYDKENQCILSAGTQRTEKITRYNNREVGGGVEGFHRCGDYVEDKHAPTVQRPEIR
jgi:hypothetical protein